MANLIYQQWYILLVVVLQNHQLIDAFPHGHPQKDTTPIASGISAIHGAVHDIFMWQLHALPSYSHA